MRFFLCILMLLIACSSNSQDLKSSYFNESQIKVLNDLVSVNDFTIAEKYNSKVSKSYFIYLSEIRESKENGQVNGTLFSSNRKYYKDLQDLGIFNLIESKSYSDEIREDKVSFRYSLNLESNYINFLSGLIKNHEKLKLYNNYLKSSGGISPGSTSLILNMFEEKDLENDSFRLILGVHFLLLLQD